MSDSHFLGFQKSPSPHVVTLKWVVHNSCSNTRCFLLFDTYTTIDGSRMRFFGAFSLGCLIPVYCVSRTPLRRSPHMCGLFESALFCKNFPTGVHASGVRTS